MTKNCEQCGKPFRWTSRNPRQRLCSSKCANDSRRTDLAVGTTFNRLSFVAIVGRTHDSHELAEWTCACGKTVRLSKCHVVNGQTKSCGCLKHEVAISGSAGRKHGMSYTPEERAYSHAKERCTNTKSPSYPDYGGRGIQFNFKSFAEFWQELGPRPTPQHSLDRIRNDDPIGYAPGNVRWATKKEQNNNRRPLRRTALRATLFGESLTLREWETRCGVYRNVIRARLHHGWCNECAITRKPEIGTNQANGCPHKKPP